MKRRLYNKKYIGRGVEVIIYQTCRGHELRLASIGNTVLSIETTCSSDELDAKRFLLGGRPTTCAITRNMLIQGLSGKGCSIGIGPIGELIAAAEKKRRLRKEQRGQT